MTLLYLFWGYLYYKTTSWEIPDELDGPTISTGRHLRPVAIRWKMCTGPIWKHRLWFGKSSNKMVFHCYVWHRRDFADVDRWCSYWRYWRWAFPRFFLLFLSRVKPEEILIHWCFIVFEPFQARRDPDVSWGWKMTPHSNFSDCQGQRVKLSQISWWTRVTHG